MKTRRFNSKLNIAIVITDTLRRVGLQALVKTMVEKSIVDCFDCFEFFIASYPDHYKIAFVEDSIALREMDYFRSSKTKLVTVITNPLNRATNPHNIYDNCLYSFSDIDEIKTSIQLSIQKKNLQDSARDAKGLSNRETEVLKEVAMGKTNKEIADFLNISSNTVMTHRKKITSKLGIKTVSGLTFYALMNGMLSAEDVEQTVESDI